MKRIVSIIVSLLILALLYWKVATKIDPQTHATLFESLKDVFRNCDPVWMSLSLGMVIPLTLFTAWRLQQLMPSRGQLGFGEANRLILVASVLNMVLPSKGGDIAKAWFMKDRSNLSGSLALSLVVFEKSCDMLSLLLWCVFGLFLYPRHDIGFVVLTMAVAGMFNFGLLLLMSVKFAQFFFGLGERFAPGKLKQKFAKFGASWAEMHEYFWSSKSRLIKVTTTSVFIW